MPPEDARESRVYLYSPSTNAGLVGLMALLAVLGIKIGIHATFARGASAGSFLRARHLQSPKTVMRLG